MKDLLIFLLVSLICVNVCKAQVLDSHVSCPIGFTLSPNGKCEKISCPQGTQLLSNGSCYFPGPCHQPVPVTQNPPIQPTQPIQPIQPTHPIHPIQPIHPVQPIPCGLNVQYQQPQLCPYNQYQNCQQTCGCQNGCQNVGCGGCNYNWDCTTTTTPTTTTTQTTPTTTQTIQTTTQTTQTTPTTPTTSPTRTTTQTIQTTRTTRTTPITITYSPTPTTNRPPCDNDKLVVIKKEPENINTKIDITNVVNNRNVVNAPTNITNVHIATIRITGDNDCRTTSVVDGVTKIVDCSPKTTRRPITTTERTGKINEKCCVIVSPRKCRKLDTKWVCTHQKYKKCGSMCRKPVMYLRAKRIQYRKPILYIPPTSNTDDISNEDDTQDCSGCIHGGYDCSRYCYNYNCEEGSDSCSFYDQNEYCEQYGGAGCRSTDGYVA